MNLCFGNCQKLSFFLGRFLGNSWLMFKNTVKIGISAHFSKQKNEKQWPFPKLITGPPAKLITGPRLGHLKIGNVAQLLTLQILGSPFLFLKKSAETPIFIVFFEKQFFIKTNVAQLLTLKWPKRGPVINSTAICCKYIYIYIFFFFFFFVFFFPWGGENPSSKTIQDFICTLSCVRCRQTHRGTYLFW